MAQFEFGEPDVTYESSNRRQNSSNVHTIRDDIDIQAQSRKSYALNYKYIVGVISLLIIIVIFSNLKTSNYKQPKHVIKTPPPSVKEEVKIVHKKSTKLSLPPREAISKSVIENVKPSLIGNPKNSAVKKSKPEITPIQVADFKITSVKKTLKKCKGRKSRYRCISSLLLDIGFNGAKNNELHLVILTPKKKYLVKKVTKSKKILIDFNNDLYLKGVYKVKLYDASKNLLYVDSFKVR